MSDKSAAFEVIREDDYVEYFLFPKLNETDSEVAEQNGLNDVLNEVTRIVGQFCANYIWHKDAFHVRAIHRNMNLLNSLDIKVPYLYGITHYGENIQDEWFVVSLLYELTRQIPGLIARVCDSDGEFLLIEAADHLPKWANPDTCEQRVYVFNGNLHLIQNSPSNTNAVLPVNTAVVKLWNNPTLYKVSHDIEECIKKRITTDVGDIVSNQHQTTIYVPIGVAKILRAKPQLIAAAVRSFCNRDDLDLKTCRAMRYFPPEERVYCSVKFTKCLYAMIMHTQYMPDRRIGWKLPIQTDPNYKSHLLGIKIACGFEILAAQASSPKTKDDLNTNKQWLNYKMSLEQKNYFQGLLDGSKEYNELLNTAKEFFIENETSMYVSPKIGVEVKQLLNSLDISKSELQEAEKNLPPSDKDDWLNVSSDDLDRMLVERYGIKKLYKPNGTVDADEFSNNIESFLNMKSDYDGIDEDPKQPIKPARGIKHTLLTPKDGQDIKETKTVGGIDFNPELFESHIKGLLDFVIPEDNWESNSDMSDYEQDDKIDEEINGMDGDQSSTNALNFQKYFEQMDKELANTTIGKSFETKNDAQPTDDFDDIEDFKPVDINVNTLKNMIASYQSQLGNAGPATNILSSIGVGLSSGNNATDNDDEDMKYQSTQV